MKLTEAQQAYLNIVNEKKSMPGPGEHGSIRISIDDDTIDFFEENKKQIKKPYTIIPDSMELWIWEGDKKYFEEWLT